MNIPFNRPCFVGKELMYIQEAVESGKISGDGIFTKKCQSFFESNYNIKKALLTTSCTDALELSALLCDISEGDEVIVPSYTFVSTANAFVLRGAKIVFADSRSDNPNIDESLIEQLITPKTKAIVPVHYAGIACEMDAITAVAEKHGLFVIEDAAQAVEATYKGKPLGSIGNTGTFSFHETKNVVCGEGGLIAINDESMIKRAEIMREKGTNRSAFFRGEIDKYGWVDIGSSFLPSEILAAYLYAQLESIKAIQSSRLSLWDRYYDHLKEYAANGLFHLPVIPEYASKNAHMFYLVCRNSDERTSLIDFLKKNGINAVFHYLALHKSKFFADKHDGRELPNSDHYTDSLVRLPLYYGLSEKEIDYICDKITEWVKR